jgi:hypothetical protein
LTLLGLNTCSSVPGTFVWSPGVVGRGIPVAKSQKTRMLG